MRLHPNLFLRASLALLLLACGHAAFAKDARCAAESAISTPIEAIQADYPAWRGKCVKVSGIAFGWTLYADRMALADSPSAAWKDSPRAIGLKQREGQPRDYTPRRIEVVGKVGSCADENAAIEQEQNSRPGEIVMTLGYCHTSLANYVAPTSTRVIDKAPVARLSEADLPPERRPLVEAPGALPGLAASQSKAQSMLQALLARDENAYVRLSEPDLVEDLDKAGKRLKPEWLRIRLADIHADYVAALKDWRPLAGQLAPDARPRTFIERADLSADQPSNGQNPRLIHCWCKQGDCAGKWPVLSLDADNLGPRPYACIATNDYLLGPGRETVIQATVPNEPGGFAEPQGS